MSLLARLSRTLLPAAVLVVPCSLMPDLATAQDAQTRPVKGTMDSLLQPLKSLEPYLVSQEKFTDPANKEKILSLLQQLRGDFHTLETIPSRFHKQPGFDENAKAVAGQLDDAVRRFSEGKSGYAWWRVHTLPNACFSCHATYQVTTTYSNDDVIDPSLDPMNRARFLLATRQFQEAQKVLLTVLEDPAYRLYSGEALRSLLVVTTRISKNPNQGVALFQEVLERAKLPEEDRQEVERWIVVLQKWAKERSAPPPSVKLAQKLIAMGTGKGVDFNRDDVSLLRGTAMLHDVLEQTNPQPNDRRTALYLLGVAYSELPMFFTDGWAEFYLEQCINEYPGSEEAKKAFKAYKSTVADAFTGSGGTHVPDDIQLQIEELKKKAFGVVGNPDRV